MKALKCTLVSDGSSDRALIPILRWLMRKHGIPVDGSIEWFDPSLPRRPATSLLGRMRQALEFFPCDLLFVHRDAESEPLTQRQREIDAAWLGLSSTASLVRVIPVRMMESWLLFDEALIRRASGCPNGKVALNLPKATTLEDLADPKERLHQTLRIATEKSGRHFKKFRVEVAVHQLAELLQDFSPLEKLSAFQRLEAEILNLRGS